MTIDFRLARTPPPVVEVFVTGYSTEDFAALREADTDPTVGYLARRGFDGGLGQVQVLPNEPHGILVVIGVGRADQVTPETFERLGVTLARTCRRHVVITTDLLDRLADPASSTNRIAAARRFAEAIVLASYRFTQLKSHPDPSRIEVVVVVSVGGKRVQSALTAGGSVAACVGHARDLVNRPGGDLTPMALSADAESVVDSSVTVRGHGRESLHALRCNGILAVNRGSVQEPRLIEAIWDPPGRSRGTVAIIGKGITFDSGGLSIKTADGMMTMKDDMAGGAAVIGLLMALPIVAPPVRVVAYIPSTDNMTGGDATRPGDVIRYRNGKTVEVMNTDAEGRLVLADALCLASESAPPDTDAVEGLAGTYTPDAIIDLATLTGSTQIALGNKIAGLMGNNDDLIKQVRDASRRSGEPVWPLPLPSEYRRYLDSEVADLRNVGTSRFGGAVIAALFLQEFVANQVPWVHLDIAGTAWSEVSEGTTAKGATGFGVRLLLDLLVNFHRPE